MTFEYKNFTLRKALGKDAKELVEITNDKEVMEFYGESGAYLKSIDEALGEIQWMNDLFKNGSARWVIVDKNEDSYIGDVGFNDLDHTHKRVEIGYKIKKEYWGQGIVPAFITQIVKYGFEELNFNRIEALVEIENIGSKKVLLKNNFSLEGILRDYEFQHGKFMDLEMYSLLKRELIK